MNLRVGSLRRSTFVIVALVAIIGLFISFRPQEASAHPLGNFTINRYSRVEIGAQDVRVRYVLDMAEIPTFQEMKALDTDGDEIVSDTERIAYLNRRTPELIERLLLTVNGSKIKLTELDSEIELPPGQGGLPTLRLSLLLGGAISQTNDKVELYFRDDNYSERIGWKEVVIKPDNSVVLTNSTVPQTDVSNELRLFPEGGISNPLNVVEAKANFLIADASAASRPASTTTALDNPVAEGDGDILTSLLSTERLSLSVIVLSLLVAIGLGALHAASPGHGKTIMAAYLVGTRGTAIHALFLGITVTVSHTLGVLGLGLIVLYASSLITPEGLFPWLSLVSGGIVVAIGFWLIAARLRGSQGHHHHAHEDGEAHGHTHDLAQVKSARNGLGWIKTAFAHSHHHHENHAQNHESPKKSTLGVTWKSLTALGVVGGLVPSTSALVILLAAISLHRVGFGIVLILAFSAGMAAVLSGVGLALVYVGRIIERVKLDNGAMRRLAGLAPYLTALVVVASGLVLAMRGLLQMGAA